MNVKLLEDIEREIDLQVEDLFKEFQDLETEVLMRVELILRRIKEGNDIFAEDKRVVAVYKTIQRTSKQTHQLNSMDLNTINKFTWSYDSFVQTLEFHMSTYLGERKTKDREKMVKNLAQLKRHHMVVDLCNKIIANLKSISTGIALLEACKEQLEIQKGE